MTHGILSAFRVGVSDWCLGSVSWVGVAGWRDRLMWIDWREHENQLVRFAGSIHWLDRLTALGFSQSHQATGL
ncbi:MAG: hypothetical protein ACAF42_17495 [Limnothrix sp. BL-A-16]